VTALSGPPVSVAVVGGSTVTLPVWAPQVGDLVLLSVAQRDETRPVSVGGNGLVWTEIVNVDNAQGPGGVSLWRGQGSAPSPGSVTVSVPGRRPSRR